MIVPGVTEDATYFYHQDALGSVAALSQFNGTTAVFVEKYSYSAFGETTVTLNGNTGNPYRFTGREYEPETGLYYYRARFYKPEIGRFLQTDPIGYADSMNLYQYCGNNPLGFIDPYGLCKGIGAPGVWESFIPIWGSLRASINDFQNGRYFWGVFNAGLAISDVFIVRSLVTSVARVGFGNLFKAGGSHTWNATTQWITRKGWRDFAGQNFHHWLLERNRGIGRLVPDIIKNQPWNLKALGRTAEESVRLHAILNSRTAGVTHAIRKWIIGTPTWAKAMEISFVGKMINLIGNSDDGY